MQMSVNPVTLGLKFKPPLPPPLPSPPSSLCFLLFLPRLLIGIRHDHLACRLRASLNTVFGILLCFCLACQGHSILHSIHSAVFLKTFSVFLKTLCIVCSVYPLFPSRISSATHYNGIGNSRNPVWFSVTS